MLAIKFCYGPDVYELKENPEYLGKEDDYPFMVLCNGCAAGYFKTLRGFNEFKKGLEAIPERKLRKYKPRRKKRFAM